MTEAETGGADVDALAPFDFDLPEDLIALRPAEPRESARLLRVTGAGDLSDHSVGDLPALLRAGDVLVVNDTRVLPAALKGSRRARDADGRDVMVDLNLIEDLGDSRWRALARPGRRLKPGDRIEIAPDLNADILAQGDAGVLSVAFDVPASVLADRLDQLGAMPLPPYIARRRAADAQDREDYQTRFASGNAKSVAAPTAGLHFTDSLLQRLDEADVSIERVRLDVGAGTFQPLSQRQIETRRLHAEVCDLSATTADRLNAARRDGRRIIPVGTTSLRTLETAVDRSGRFFPFTGETDIFLRPGGPEIASADALITNFHLPRSSLFMLVCAIMGTDVMQAAYHHAITNRYRFFSYGDACLLEPHG